MGKYLFHQLKSYQLSAIDYQPFHYLQNRAARIIFNKNNINQIKTTTAITHCFKCLPNKIVRTS